MLKILCPVDLGEASLNAINFAGNFTRKLGGSLTLFHAVPEANLITREDFASNELLEMQNKAMETLEKVCTETSKEFAIDCDYIVELDTLNHGITKVAKSREIDLILMGTKGVQNVAEYLGGSNTVHVMEHADIPVLAIPAEHYKSEINNIVYATNYQVGDDESLTQLLHFANSLDCRLTIIHVSHKGNPAKLEIFKSYRDYVFDEFYYDLDVKIEQVVYDDVEEGLREYMRVNNGDVLAMLTHHRNFFQEVFHTSMTRKMTLLAEYPVLVFHK
ncbi:universal stress protein [Flexithrix dorotheae]|uniref:universal stress protein n=1 Tax=Flexithrix dorotheae TaxID=70993 RepID=UPI00036F2922|nr:universal stress protein [Flexithrix dorotheae]